MIINYRHSDERVQDNNVLKSHFPPKMKQNANFLIGFYSKTIKNSLKPKLKQVA